MSLLLRRGHKGPGTDSDPCCGVLAFVGPFLRAVNQGKFHPSPGWTWCGSEPEPPEAELRYGMNPCSSLLWLGVQWCPLSAGSAAADLCLSGKCLQISTHKTNSKASFCPNEEKAAAGSLCPPGSLQHLRAWPNYLISVGVFSSSVCLGWQPEVAVQVRTSLLLFFLLQLVS